MQVNALVADRHLPFNLLGATLNAKVEVYIGPDLWIYAAVFTAAQGSFRPIIGKLVGTIASMTITPTEFATNGDAAPVQ
jgi:hypothetical protein